METSSTEYPCPSEFVSLANDIALNVGAIHQRYFRQGVDVEIKGDGSPVTHVDKSVEMMAREIIQDKFPEHGIIGEEYPAHQPDADYVWIIDPIDGTTDFIFGQPVFGFLLALSYRGKLILGVIDQPITGDRWIGANSLGTTHNGSQVRSRSCSDLSQAAINTIGSDTFAKSNGDKFGRLRDASNRVMIGGGCYAFGLLAMGQIDLIVSSHHGMHDFAALEPVVRNAGGTMIDWAGSEIDVHSDGTLIASGDVKLAGKIQAFLSGHDPTGASRKSQPPKSTKN